MATGDDVTRIAMGLAETTSAAHFDRTAFKVVRIYATLGAGSLNLKLSPEEQEFKTMMAPDIFTPIAGGWGRQGWTTVDLKAIAADELEAVLAMAWEHGRAKSLRKR